MAKLAYSPLRDCGRWHSLVDRSGHRCHLHLPDTKRKGGLRLRLLMGEKLQCNARRFGRHFSPLRLHLPALYHCMAVLKLGVRHPLGLRYPAHNMVPRFAL